MSKIMTWSTGLALACVLAGYGPSAAAASRVAGDSWGRVIEVPGLAALNTAQHNGAEVDAVSCASAGNCAAGGDYSARHAQQGFVTVERNGRWARAAGVPGLAALNGGGFAGVLSMSCSSAGHCAAGGHTSDPDGQDFYGFVTSQEHGVWGKAKLLPGGEEDGEVDAISCASAGNCVAGGAQSSEYFYTFKAFLAQERNGHWGKAIAVPGLKALNKGEASEVDSVWCASAGNCVVGGDYTQRNGDCQGFVVVERNGTWGAAMEVPGLAALNKRGDAEVSSVSCSSASDCLGGGYYSASSGQRGFVVIERNGHWRAATAVPGLEALNKGNRPTQVLTVSCAPGGRCAAGGYYSDSSHRRQGFVTTEDNGRWGTPIPLPGLAALNKGGFAEVGSLSCSSRGNCAAGGIYTDGAGHHWGFVTQAG
jgi:hypothetical protein